MNSFPALYIWYVNNDQKIRNLIWQLVYLSVVKIGVITYGETASLQIPFNAYSNITELYTAIKSLSYMGGKTHTSAGLTMMVSQHLSVITKQNKENVLVHVWLKGLAQAKIIKNSVILFRVLNMTIWCKHVHRLELQIFIIFVLRVHQLG